MLDYIPPDILDGLVKAFKYIYWATPIWLPILFLTMLFNAWIYYRRAYYWNVKLGSCLLELKLPANVDKSPLAMELVLNQMHQPPDEGDWYWKYWRGQTRSWFSLEIVSFGGDIHFYVWTRKKYKPGMEAHFYSQYPGVEIYEVEDYTKDYVFDPEKHDMAACQWELTDPDPYPIATYVDYGLDKDPKEEQKVDPMTNFLEFAGSLPQGHNLWAQIIVRAHKKEQKRWAPSLDKFQLFETYDSWKDEAKAEKNKILEELKASKEEGGFARIPSKGEAEKIAALERSVGKPGFDTTIRTIYFADKDKFNGFFLGGMLGSLKQYGSIGYNGFKGAGLSLSYKGRWFSDWWKPVKSKIHMIAMEEYKLRRFFFSPHMGKWFYSKPFVLNSEELATIFHLPGLVATTPGIPRVPSKKVEAPSNLPI